MAMTQEQVSKFQAWFKAKDATGRNRFCPICGESRWALGDIAADLAYNNGAVVLGAATVTPVAQIYCESCGYIQYFSAKLIGLV